MIYAFEDFELDTERRELRRLGALVEIQPKVYVLLLHLLRNRQRVISREEIFQVLWPDVVVSEDALFNALRKARAAVGDDGGSQRVILTVPKVGYRFVSEVVEQAEEPSSTASRSEPARASPPLSAPASPLVGRHAEFATLLGALESTLAGSGKIAFLVGEAGIGKTRLAREIATIAQSRGADVREASSWPSPGEPALWLWTQILRSFAESWSAADLGRVMADTASQIARLAPVLEEKLGLTVPVVRDTDEARFLLMDAIARFLVQASNERPQVLLLEDLHWAPPTTLHVLEYLARFLAQSRLLLVVTCRIEELGADHPIHDALAACEQADVLVRVPLGGFDATGLAPFVEATAGFAASPALIDALQVATGGNPFFVKQIVTLAFADPPAEQSAESRLAAHVRTLPAGVRRVLDRRLALLSDPCRQVVQIASVAGADFTLALLARISPLPREKLLDTLEEAIRARLVENNPSPRGGYRFTHALVRDAAYAGLPEPTRVQLHRRVAEALESLHPGALESVVPALAYHYGEAAPLLDGTQAVDLSKWAGDLATAALSYEEAAAHYDRALLAFDLLRDSSDVRRRAELLVCAGYAHHNAGAFPRARQTLREAAMLAQGIRDPALLVFAAVGFAEIGLGVVDPEPVQYLESALALLAPGGGFVHVWLRSVLAVHLMNHPGRLDDADRTARDAERLARASGDPRSLCYALGARAAVLRILPAGRPEARVALLREADLYTAEAGDRSVEILGHIQLRGALIDLGDLAGAEALNGHIERILPRMRTRYFGGVPDGFRVARALLDGRFADAEERIQSNLPNPDGPRSSFAMAASALACSRYCQGRLGELAPALASLVAERPHLLTAYAALILVLIERGEMADARARFDTLARRDFADVIGTESSLVTLAILAEACARMEDSERAATLMQMLEPHARYCATLTNGFYVHGPVALHIGILATTRRDWDAAERHLASALEQAETALGSPVWRAYTLAARARFHLLRNASGDRRRAGRDVEEAADIAGKLGMAGLVRELDVTKASLRA